MGRSRPHRSSSRSVPRLRTPSDRRKACFVEHGFDYDHSTGKTSVYVDVINGNADLVDYVGFRFWPSGDTYNVHKRSTIILSDMNVVKRFRLKESSVDNWSKKITVMIVGKGGSRRVRRLKAKPRDFRERSLKFLETRALRQKYSASPEFRFGVELETSLSGRTTPDHVVDAIRVLADVQVKNRMNDYRRGSENYGTWQVVPDGSTECSRSNPNCNKFELVSRILSGKKGLAECKRVLAALKKLGKVSTNHSMGFHVHVDAEDLPLEHLKNICLNFVKHESALNSVMPASRHESDYCKSNADAILGNPGLKHNAIVSCDNVSDLCDLLNPGHKSKARYYKLNLQNLHPDRASKKKAKPTIEFRQHSGTTDFEKLRAWVLLCTSLVQNSVERPQKLHTYEDAFESLFDTVVQDVKLKDFYRKRRHELSVKRQNHDGEACCRGCTKDEGTCEGTTYEGGFLGTMYAI